MAAAQAGDKVAIHYTGRFEDGDIFDTSQGREPLEFTAGGPELIPGVSQAVVGMNPGDKKTVTIAPENGYGDREEGLSRQVPRQYLPQEVKVGDPLQAQFGEETAVVWVTELNDEFGTVDANHPLAGKILVFDIELLSIAG